MYYARMSPHVLWTWTSYFVLRLACIEYSERIGYGVVIGDSSDLCHTCMLYVDSELRSSGSPCMAETIWDVNTFRTARTLLLATRHLTKTIPPSFFILCRARSCHHINYPCGQGRFSCYSEIIPRAKACAMGHACWLSQFSPVS